MTQTTESPGFPGRFTLVLSFLSHASPEPAQWERSYNLRPFS
jgi:hypothetical protein